MSCNTYMKVQCNKEIGFYRANVCINFVHLTWFTGLHVDTGFFFFTVTDVYNYMACSFSCSVCNNVICLVGQKTVCPNRNAPKTILHWVPFNLRLALASADTRIAAAVVIPLKDRIITISISAKIKKNTNKTKY